VTAVEKEVEVEVAELELDVEQEYSVLKTAIEKELSFLKVHLHQQSRTHTHAHTQALVYTRGARSSTHSYSLPPSAPAAQEAEQELVDDVQSLTNSEKRKVGVVGALFKAWHERNALYGT
jgi:hypothetical protein